MRYVTVKVDRDERLQICREVVPWEIPVLRLIHGAEKVVELDAPHNLVDRELPTAEAEFERLALRYGVNPATETPYSVMVFGQAPQGVFALQRIMDESEDIAANGPKVAVEKAAPVAPVALKVKAAKAKAKQAKAEAKPAVAVVDSEDDPTA